MLSKKIKQQLLKKATELGAADAKFIRAERIEVGAWTRWKCQYGCPNYGKTLCCPPYAPDYHETEALIRSFEYALLVQFVQPMPEGDKVNWQEVDKNISNNLLDLLLGIEREAFILNCYKAFALKAGRCHLCPDCNLKFCAHPQKARPSMEACGIDVMALANACGYKAKVLTGPVKEMKIYGLVLID